MKRKELEEEVVVVVACFYVLFGNSLEITEENHENSQS